MNDYDEINFEELRDDLIDYIGTAINIIPMAEFDLLRVMNSSNDELLSIAHEFNFDITNYINKRFK